MGIYRSRLKGRNLFSHFQVLHSTWYQNPRLVNLGIKKRTFVCGLNRQSSKFNVNLYCRLLRVSLLSEPCHSWKHRSCHTHLHLVLPLSPPCTADVSFSHCWKGRAITLDLLVPAKIHRHYHWSRDRALALTANKDREHLVCATASPYSQLILYTLDKIYHWMLSN